MKAKITPALLLIILVAGFSMNLRSQKIDCLTRSYDSLVSTLYDMQTNLSSGQQRIYMFPDKTISVVTMGSHNSSGNTWTDRGSMYNYYNGSSWQPAPVSRIESMRTGWPSIQPWGPTGECILSHQGSGGLVLSTRAGKGTGTWTTTTNLAPPSGVTSMLWARMVTTGSNYMNIHVIALTEPLVNGGTLYNGMDGALLYNSSSDGGSNWGTWQQLSGMTSSDYLSFAHDAYAWAQPHGDTLAFVAGNNYQDEFIMKSTDNGNTWTKTIIYQSDYNLTGGNSNNQWIYCPDGTSAISLDHSGMAHVCFGLMKDSNIYYSPYTQGLIYWNENMPSLPRSLNPDSLKLMGNYIGWVVDTSIFSDTVHHLAYYYTSLTSNPAITIDINNDIFAVWAGVSSKVDSTGNFFRHIYERTAHIGNDKHVVWNQSIRDLTCENKYDNSECMYPDISPATDENIWVLFQKAGIAGSYVKCLTVSPGTCLYASDHEMEVLKALKFDLGVGFEEKEKPVPSLIVSDNIPNPFDRFTTINVIAGEEGNLQLDVVDFTGRQLKKIDKGHVGKGAHKFTINRDQLNAGIYFYTVRLDNERVTKKMIVE